MKPTPQRINPWPYAIIGWFVIFGTAMATWAVYAMRQDIDLIRSDYYEAEVHFQRQLDQSNQSQSIAGAVNFAFDPANREIIVSVPETLAISAFGKVQLYRPSNAKLDRKLAFSPDAHGLQRIDASGLEPGLWKIRVEWASDGKEYFIDRPVIVAGN